MNFATSNSPWITLAILSVEVEVQPIITIGEEHDK